MKALKDSGISVISMQGPSGLAQRGKSDSGKEASLRSTKNGLPNIRCVADTKEFGIRAALFVSPSG